MGRLNGGLWFRRYWQNVFQSLRFWLSYRLGVVAEGDDEDALAVGVVGTVGLDDGKPLVFGGGETKSIKIF